MQLLLRPFTRRRMTHALVWHAILIYHRPRTLVILTHYNVSSKIMYAYIIPRPTEVGQIPFDYLLLIRLYNYGKFLDLKEDRSLHSPQRVKHAVISIRINHGRLSTRARAPMPPAGVGSRSLDRFPFRWATRGLTNSLRSESGPTCPRPPQVPLNL